MRSGATFERREATGKVVDVYGFHDLLNTMWNVEVVTAIKAIDLDGNTTISGFNKSLWFGETMEHLPLPPIQI